MQFLQYGSYDADARSDEFGTVVEGESMTVQDQAYDADINNIVRAFGVTGKLPESVRKPQYEDFDGVGDFRQCLHALMEAEASFMQMPSALRESLGNDPARFVEWCADSRNAEEMKKYGLIDADLSPAPDAPLTTPVVIQAGPVV